jgi:hypothetical protein
MNRGIKKVMGLSLLLSLVATYGYAAAKPEIETGNLVTNGSFEKWQQLPAKIAQPAFKMPDGVPVGWKAYQSAYETKSNPDFKIKGAIFKDEKVKHNGKSSLRIENGLITDITEVHQIFPILKNTEYLVRVWVKGEDIVPNTKGGAGVIVWANFGPKKHFQRRSFYKIPKKSTGTFGWQLVEFTVDTDSKAEVMVVVVQLRRATGKAWYDEVEVLPQGVVKPVESF